MYPYDDHIEENNGASNSDPPAENDEDCFIPPADHPSYRDADYTPESEATIPPRYYVPEEKPPKEKKPKAEGQIRFGKVVTLCLCCAVVGGLAGGGLAGYYFNAAGGKENADLNSTPLLSASNPFETAQTAVPMNTGGVTAGDIYALGCTQVVGITTEITTTNFFGMTSSVPISGSGFVITENGYILTNYHVIENAYLGGYEISVMLYDGNEYTAEIVGHDADNDIAVLKIVASGFSPVSLGNSETLSVGDTVYAIGNPLGELAYTMTSGIVSATDRIITVDESTSLNMFQFDAAVNAGNSGGPVYNGAGQVVGVVTAKYKETGVEGLGFAIPINDAVDIANELIANGYVSGKAYMGVVPDTVPASVAQYYNLVQGAYVYSIESGSAAETAGLKVGDIVTEMNGVSILSADDLKAEVKQHSAGETVGIKVYRSGEYLELSITFDEKQPDSNAASDGQPQTFPSGYPYASGW